MRLASLLSGGKDSVYAAHLMQREHQLSYMVSMKPENPDSYMFHTVNIDITKLQAEAWGIPYVEAKTKGVKEKELDDLKEILSALDIDGVITGAIVSKYQSDRVNRLCDELGMTHFFPLWARDREQLLHEMLDIGMKIIFSSVAAHGLDQSWLGEPITPERIVNLKTLRDRFGVDMCGEGGEYESLVLDAPWFNRRIQIMETEKTWDGVSGRYNIKTAQLVDR
ncbi:TIGR00289 family protein [Candidatus Bathyarchaeota archaeon]|nr:TIGR00289 family protein [Candidatus Bathyarchaeota archaeon]